MLIGTGTTDPTEATMTDDERDAHTAAVAQLRHEIEFYEHLLSERRELLGEAEYNLGVIDGRRQGGQTR
jgi:hypothetical protein